MDALRFFFEFRSDSRVVEAIPIRELEWLFCHALPNITKAEWGSHELTDDEAATIAAGVTRLVDGEPLAYVLGDVDFLRCKIEVNRNVLIPRPETEYLCELIVARFRGRRVKILDLCTGSGCIAVGLQRALPYAQVDAADISADALAVASANARGNDVDVRFFESDMLQNIPDKYHAIVCNPPYIDESDMLELPSSVWGYEPHLALYGGRDGLDFYRDLAENAPEYLLERGDLFLEVGEQQAEKVVALLEQNFEDIQIREDLFGKKRYVFARRR